MTMFWKKKQFWGVLIGIALLLFCIKDIKLEELRSLQDRLDPLYLIPALISGLLFIALKSLRFRTIISRQKVVPHARIITLYSTGAILSIIMPALTGQVGRVMLFSRKLELRKTFIFSTFVLEILFDAISLIIFMLLTSLAFAFPSEYRYLSYVVVATTVAGVILLYLIIHFQTGLEEIGKRKLRGRWPGVYVTIKKFMRSFTKGIDLLKSSQHMLGSMTYSILSWSAHVLVVWFLMIAFGLDLPFAAAAVVMIINTIVLMVPITPGNAGTFELAVSTSLAAFSVARSDAVLFALALHMMDLIPVFLFAAFYMKVDRKALNEIRRRNEESDIIDRINEDGAFIEEEPV